MELQTIDSYFYRKLGHEISKQRHREKKSLKEVAKQLGMTKQNLDDIELGRRKMTKNLYLKMCKVLDLENINFNVSIEYKNGELI